MNAYEELRVYLNVDEMVEALVFGPWGWDGYEELEPQSVPPEKRGIVLKLKEAEPLMKGWSFEGGFGAPNCYAVYIWTNQRIIWVTQYDGSTGLDSCPRNPIDIVPDMPGG